jgi:putative tryptophan/tyrosine transport system substrate-binding protein
MTRVAVALLALGLVAAPLAAEAQAGGRVYRVGVLTPGVRPVPSFPTTAHLLPLALRELGYVEGQNLAIQQRFAEGKVERLPGLARELTPIGE